MEKFSKINRKSAEKTYSKDIKAMAKQKHKTGKKNLNITKKLSLEIKKKNNVDLFQN